MANEDWKLQVSYKTPSGDMINIRANTAEELSVLLEGTSEVSPQIAATGRMIGANYNAAPLGTASSTASTAPAVSSPTSQPSQASGTGLSSPTCIHGTRIYRKGVSKKTGEPYAFWACPTPQGTPDQCKPLN